jgi:hypothetical protein
MTPAKSTKGDIEARAALVAFPKPDDWQNIVHDLKLTKAQERELEITIGHALTDIKRYQAVKHEQLPRDVLVAALKRLERALGLVRDEMASSGYLMSHFLSNKTLEFIGRSFTVTAMQKAVGKNDLKADSLNDQIALGYKHGAEILKYFVDEIHDALKSWVELDRRNKGGRPADIYRQYMIQRLAGRAPRIIGKEATTTAKGKFEKLCVAVVDACGFNSTGIEKAIEAVLAKMNGNDEAKPVKRKARSKK